MGSDHIKELLLVLLDVIIVLQFCKLCVCVWEQECGGRKVAPSLARVGWAAVAECAGRSKGSRVGDEDRWQETGCADWGKS